MTVSAPAPNADAARPALGALSRLIQEANDSGISYQTFASRTAEAGEPLTKQYFQKLVKTPPASAPDPKKLRAIAAALRKPESVVKRAAAAQWLEYEATELSGYDEEIRIVVAHLAGKSPAEVRRWRVMIEADEQAKRDS